MYGLYQQHLAPRAAANPNQEIVLWCDDHDDADTFHLFEIYGAAEAFQENAGSAFFAQYMAEAGPLLAGQPQVRMASPRWSTGI